MKLRAEHIKLVEHLYCTGNWKSPLEIAAELGLTFRQVCAVIDKHCLRQVFYPIARGVEKATRAGSYPAADCGFEPPDWRL